MIMGPGTAHCLGQCVFQSRGVPSRPFHEKSGKHPWKCNWEVVNQSIYTAHICWDKSFVSHGLAFCNHRFPETFEPLDDGQNLVIFPGPTVFARTRENERKTARVPVALGCRFTCFVGGKLSTP